MAAHQHDIRVTWADCDPANIAYTGRIPAFALDAINAWWEAHMEGAGFYELNLDHNLGTPFVRMELDFSAPITPRHLLRCTVWPCALGRTSIAFRVDGLQDETLCFRGKFTSVFVKADVFEKQDPPADVRALVTRHLLPE